MDFDCKYVICGKDCNKHESKIFACYDSMKKCIDYLNEQGDKLCNDFDIEKYKVTDEEYLDASMFNVTFRHVELFKFLYAMDESEARCTHHGEIHIACIDRSDDFGDVYQRLRETYV